MEFIKALKESILDVLCDAFFVAQVLFTEWPRVIIQWKFRH